METLINGGKIFLSKLKEIRFFKEIFMKNLNFMGININEIYIYKK